MQAIAGASPPTEPAALRLLGRVIGLINRIAIAISAAGVLVSLALIAWAVVMRYAFGRPPVWVDEVVGFMLVGIVMLASADVLRRGGHIGVDLLTGRLGTRGRLWARAWSSLAALGAALVFVVNGWETAMFARQLGIATEGHLELPQYLLMLLLPLGGVLMGLTAGEALLRLALGAAPLDVEGHAPATTAESAP